MAQDTSKKNNGLPFGLCARYGIQVPKGSTPKDAWDLLKKNGIYPPWTKKGAAQYDDNGNFVGDSNVKAQDTRKQGSDSSSDNKPAPQPKSTYQTFKEMDEDGRVDFLDKNLKADVPVFLTDNDLQRVLYVLGKDRNMKPKVVSDAALDNMQGVAMYRTVNSAKLKQYKITMSAPQIAEQIIKGSSTQVSSVGGSAYGRGLYFSTSYHGSTVYGDYTNSINDTAMVRCKLDPNAKIIDSGDCRGEVNREINSGTKLGRMLSKVDHYSQTALWCLVKGYAGTCSDTRLSNNRNIYVSIVDRTQMVISDKINPKTSIGWS